MPLRATNKELAKQAREILASRWEIVLTSYLLLMIPATVIYIIPYFGIVAMLLFTGPWMLGYSAFFLAVSRGEPADVYLILSGFTRFETAFRAYLLVIALIISWAFALFIPGVIAAFSYSQTFFILADKPDQSIFAAVKRSKKIMIGLKGKYLMLMIRIMIWPMIIFFTLFCVTLFFSGGRLQSFVANSVLGVSILTIVDFAVGLIFVPYMAIAQARFYNDVSGDETDSEVVS